MRVPLESATFESARFGAVPQLNAVATIGGDGATVFVVNRSTTDAASLTLDVSALADTLGREPRIVETHVLHDDDLSATNTLDDPDRVTPRELDGAVLEGAVLTATLPPVSWAAVHMQ